VNWTQTTGTFNGFSKQKRDLERLEKPQISICQQHPRRINAQNHHLADVHNLLGFDQQLIGRTTIRESFGLLERSGKCRNPNRVDKFVRET
jgi:hypothetical protein